MSTTTFGKPKREVSPRDEVRKARSRFPRVVALIFISTLAGLVLCEVGLRLLGWTRAETRLPAAVSKPEPQAEVAAALRYVARLPAVPGTDRRWFLEEPPPLPNRAPVLRQQVERYRDFERRGIFGAQAEYIWNRYYVESERCGPNNTFRNFPETVPAFDPPEESVHPRYRFPANYTTAGGLVTNQFGLRGRPVPLAKPPKTIRIAFAGASTTVGFHGFAFSYPERVEGWLNRWAAANHLGVRFEALNAGREGLNSEDIQAIVRDELLPLDPDLVVYYEGSNQFQSANEMVFPHIPPREHIDPKDQVVDHIVPQVIRTHLALGNLLDRGLAGLRSTEPRKPAYQLRWPAGVDERNPDVASPNLPLHLPTIVRDLDSIRDSARSIGAQLALCSFEWLSSDRLQLSPVRQPYIYRQLNTELWPLRYADIRRLADFQNRAYRRYAASRSVPFLDVASLIPQDPALFIDAIHMTEAGDRLKAWIVFQQLVPLLRRKIGSGELPRPSGSHALPPPPSLASAPVSTRCIEKPGGPLERIGNALYLETIDLAYGRASIEYGHPVKVVTADAQWSYAASIFLNTPAGLARPCYVYLRARVTRGQVGVGILDGQTEALQLETAVNPSAGMADIYVPILFPDRADAVLIRNTAPGGVRSEILIDDAALVAFLKPPPEEVMQTIPVDAVQLVDRSAALETIPAGLSVTTGPGQGAYAGKVALGLEAGSAAGLRVHVRLRVLEGVIGVGVLRPDGKAFLFERMVHPTSQTAEVVIPLPAPPQTGGLIIRNGMAGNIASKAILERIEIRRAP